MVTQKNRKKNIFRFLNNFNKDVLSIWTHEDEFLGLIDTECQEIISRFYWNKTNTGYIYNYRTNTFLHNFVMAIEIHTFDAEVDHINVDKTDNRRCNLRIVNRQINNLNRGLNKNNSSGYKGVAWHKQRNKWRAYIMLDHKQISLGLYDDVEEAYKVRLEKENEIMSKLLEDYGNSK